MPTKTIIIIGGGTAGMEAASRLDKLGYKVILFEKEKTLGGHIRNWYQLFPDRRPGNEVYEYLHDALENSGVTIKYGAELTHVSRVNGHFEITDHNLAKIYTDAVLLTTGFDLFDARLKEEYGYRVYPNVITSSELEGMFKTGKLLTLAGDIPRRVGMVHCVGSRDEKCGNYYCSKVCCVTGVKQAIEIREMSPDTEVFCFYMDMRMFGPGYEELYRESQEKWGIQFIRGRVSEAAENPDGSIQIKAEDTLAGRPLKMSVDMLVLLAGMVPSEGTTQMGNLFHLSFGDNRFLNTSDKHYGSNVTDHKGVFVAGTCCAPMNITDTLNHARSAVLEIDNYLKNNE